ncbi:hypothetical protein [Stackebrandtia soli]|uniref:hypothetical protein n=1 Tax=Stackebrandtia soli TaxID=1892856 RepID=UPI0039E90434
MSTPRRSRPSTLDRTATVTTDGRAVVELSSVPPLGRFLARACRLDPNALVRLRAGAAGTVEAWVVLPFDVLAMTSVPGDFDGDRAVLAAELLRVLDGGELPVSRDRQWRGALPRGTGEIVEEIPVADIRRIGEAAAATLRAARGQGVGDRRLRDVLLDQVVVTVLDDDGDHAVRLRLVVGLLRMGLADAGVVRVRRLGGRLGLEADMGTVWSSDPGLTLL